METTPTLVLPDIEHPRGIFSARIDDKGRLKLPAAFAKFLSDSGATKVFVTSLDERVGKIYTIALWRQVEKMLEARGQAGRGILFLANDYGQDVEVDSQGRMLIPAELRRALGLEKEEVKLQYEKGGIVFYTNEVYLEQKKQAHAIRQEAMKTFIEEGFL